MDIGAPVKRVISEPLSSPIPERAPALPLGTEPQRPTMVPEYAPEFAPEPDANPVRIDPEVAPVLIPA